MAAAAARLLLPRATRTRAAASSSSLLHRPLESFSRCFRSLGPPLPRPPPAVFPRHLSDATFDAQVLDSRVPATVITGFLGSGKVGQGAPKQNPVAPTMRPSRIVYTLSRRDTGHLFCQITILLCICVSGLWYSRS